MYHLESAKVKPAFQKSFWLDEDVSSKLIKDMFTDYREAIFILTNDFLTGTLYLNMEDIKPLNFLDENLTLSQWFTAINNLSLPTTTTPPDFTAKYVRYGDAWRANYQFKNVPSVYNPLMEDLPESMKVDLLMERENTDYLLMGKRCLVSINGFLHLAEGSVNGLQVREAGKNVKYCNKTQVGILSFNDIGDFTLLPINRNMVKQPHPSVELKSKVYIDLGMDLSNKSVLLSLGGYLHAFDNVVNVGGLTTMIIDWYKIPFAKRYFEQRRFMDMSSLGLSSSVNNPSQISIEEFYSNETILRYLEMTQSFFIIFDNQDLFSEFHIIESGKLPGKYYNDEYPTQPLQLGLGRLGNYWKFYDDQKWVLSVEDNFYNYYNFETTSYLQENSIDDTRRTEKPFEYADAYLMNIGVA
jgi:hypothetical protein